MVAKKLLCFVVVVFSLDINERGIWSRSHIVIFLVLDQEVGFADEENTDEL